MQDVATPDGELLKESPFRSVIRLFENESRRPCVLKSYRGRRFGRDRARIEQANLVEARKRGIPCPAPVRYARESRSKSWLMLEDLGDGCSVDRAIRDRTPDEAKLLLERCGTLIGQALQSGLDHRDLHLGNLYVTRAGELFLLDLHDARFRSRRVPPTFARLRGLYLSLPWPDQASLRASLFGPLGAPATPSSLAPALRKHLRKRLARCTRSSGAFVRREHDGRPVLQRRGFAGDPRTWRDAIRAGDELKAGRRGRVVRSSAGVAKLRDEAPSLALWHAAEALALRRIAHATGLAWFADDATDRWWVLSADTAGQPLASLSPTTRPCRDVVDDLAVALARLHATGWRARDPRGDNRCVVAGRAVMLDLDGVRPFPPWRTGAVRAADLGRLLAWLRYQAPSPLADAAESLQRRFSARYCRESARLGHRLSQTTLAAAVLRRAERWRRRHA